MKPQRLVLLALAFAATGAVGCFTDPTKDLRSGGTTLSVSDQAVYLRTGDSVAVVAELKDNQGNVLPAAGASWATGDASIADVRVDTVVIPGNYFSRAFIRGVTLTGGWTSVIVTIGSVSDTLRVTVMPAGVTGALVSTSGTAQADTVVVPAQTGPPAVPAKYIAISAPDTLVIAGTSVLNFDTAKVSAYANTPSGAVAGYVIAKTPTQIKVVFAAGPDSGKVVVKHLLLVTGNSSVGTIVLDSLVTAPQLISRVRYKGTVTQTGDTVYVNASANQSFTSSTTVKIGTTSGFIFSHTASQLQVIFTKATTGLVTLANSKMGTATLVGITGVTPVTSTVATFPGASISQLGDTMYIVAPANIFFTSSTGVAFDTVPGIILSQDSTHLSVLSPATYSGPVTVQKAKLGSDAIAVTALKTSGSFSINAATFQGTASTPGLLMDTVKVYAGAITKFDTSSSKASSILTNKVGAFTLLLTPDSMYVFAKRTSTGPLGVTNVVVGSTVISALNMASTTLIGPVTGEANEPGNDTRSTATTVAFTGATDTIVIYGSIDCEDDGTACPGNGDIIDYYKVSYAGGQKLRAIVTWFGNGTGGPNYTDTNNPDIDVAIMDLGNTTKYGTGTPTNGSGQLMPEIATTSTALAAGDYYFRILAWLTPSPIVYQLKILRTD